LPDAGDAYTTLPTSSDLIPVVTCSSITGVSAIGCSVTGALTTGFVTLSQYCLTTSAFSGLVKKFLITSLEF